ncbi:MAG: CDP-diacylglycerol--glycerol-3-phosphate 3-phosphatidyltransferase [Fimbriiglobus sp.]
MNATAAPSESLLNIPNLLSLSRLPLAVVLCGFVAAELWPVALGVFVLAALTDWADGWWARKYGPMTAVGRSLDPLTDKVLVGSAFIFLIPVPEAGVHPWMVAVVVGREVFVTGLRGMVEAGGKKFGADWFGKLKTMLQMAALTGALLLRAVPAAEPLHPVYSVLLWAAVVATVGSAVQYTVKAAKLLR